MEAYQQEWARSLRVHGVRGGISLHIFPGPERPTPVSGDRVFLQPLVPGSCLPSAGQWWGVEKITLGHKAIVFFDGINNRNEAQALLPFALMLPGISPPLLGLRALDTEGIFLGTVAHVFYNGAQEVMEIEGPCPMILPAVGPFIKGIDMVSGSVTVLRPEYL